MIDPSPELDAQLRSFIKGIPPDAKIHLAPMGPNSIAVYFSPDFKDEDFDYKVNFTAPELQWDSSQTDYTP